MIDVKAGNVLEQYTNGKVKQGEKPTISSINGAYLFGEEEN